MPRRLMQVLVAIVVALAAAIPASGRAMPMQAGMTGMAVAQHCPNCPRQSPSGAIPGKMLCQTLACAGAVATLPSPTLLPGRAFLRAAYPLAMPARMAGLRPAPDPFPPRSIARP